jgi:hypothetical protein
LAWVLGIGLVEAQDLARVVGLSIIALDEWFSLTILYRSILGRHVCVYPALALRLWCGRSIAENANIHKKKPVKENVIVIDLQYVFCGLCAELVACLDGVSMTIDRRISSRSLPAHDGG